jgi:hypothetical protein
MRVVDQESSSFMITVAGSSFFFPQIPQAIYNLLLFMQRCSKQSILRTGDSIEECSLFANVERRRDQKIGIAATHGRLLLVVSPD